MHEQQALTASMTTALACPYLSTPLNLTIWSAGNILWLQVNFFSVTPSAGGVKGGSGLPWTPTCSQIPQNHLFFFKHIFFPFLGELEAHSAPFPGSAPCPSSGQRFANIHRTQAKPTPCQQVPLVAGICTTEVPLVLR